MSLKSKQWVVGEIRASVNKKELNLECAIVLHKSLLILTLIMEVRPSGNYEGEREFENKSGTDGYNRNE